MLAGMTASKLRKLRKRRNLTLKEVAARVHSVPSAIQKVETKPDRMTWGWAQRLAAVYDVDPVELMHGGEPPLVPVVGYVGAGAQVFPIDDCPKGVGIAEAICPRRLNPETTVAVQVRGDSMLPLEDGWLLFYSRREEATAEEIVGHLCVVKVAGEGPTLVKKVRPGYRRGRFNLLSTNADPIEDVELEWAARVRAVVAPDLDGEAEAA